MLLSRYVVSGSLLSSLCFSILFTKIIIISLSMEAMRSSKLIYIGNLMFDIILFHMCDKTLQKLFYENVHFEPSEEHCI